MASNNEDASNLLNLKVVKQKKKASEEELRIEGYSIDGLSIAGHETCVILPSLNLAFDIGKCPQRAVSQQFLFISHGHMDHIVIAPPLSCCILPIMLQLQICMGLADAIPIIFAVFTINLHICTWLCE